MTRAFKAYESSNEYIRSISSTRSKFLDNSTLTTLIHFIHQYIEGFCTKADGVSYFKSFDMEFVRMLNYLLKFGLFIYRNNNFQKEDIDLVFSYLCHLCDIFTSKSYIKAFHSLDKIISKDTIVSDVSNLNPIERASHDIKYTLFNKSYSEAEMKRQEFADYFSIHSMYFHNKILIEIISIFHLFNDLRQHFLMSNNVEFFYKKIYLNYRTKDNQSHTAEETEEMNKMLLKEFKNIIPDSQTFNNHMNYELPSIDKMYENDELAKFDIALKKNENYVEEMHDEYVTLMIDTFNLHNYDPFLRQLIILLICRYHSERAEFIRNLDRVILFFDDSDWSFYKWTLQQLDKFVFYSEKSNIWLLKIKNMIIDSADDIEDVDKNEELDELMTILKNLKQAVVYKSDITISNDLESLDLKVHKGDRKINRYSQNLYRNVKVYDYLINFLFQNKELLVKVRKIDLEVLQGKKRQVVETVRKIFKRIFRILEVMTVNNHKTQDLMWKYKEDFVFEELGASEQEGELELVLAIIDDTKEAIKYNQNKYTLSKTRRFVNSLNKRVGHESNFVLLLEIYNKLIKFEAISFLKHSLVKLILKNPDNIYTHDKQTRRDFEKCLNIQEIIYSVIYNQDMIFVREYLKDIFPLERFFEIIDSSIENLNRLEEDDVVYDAQDYDELRDYQYIALINIYTQLYLNAKHSDTDRDELLGNFKDRIAPQYIRKLNQFNIESDFYDNSTFKKSRMLFLLDYMQVFLNGIRRYVAQSQDEQLKEGNARRSTVNYESMLLDESQDETLGSFSGVKKAISNIEQMFNEVNERLIECDNEDIMEFVEFIHHDEEAQSSNTNLNSRRSSKIKHQKSIRVFKPSTSSSKMTNLRSTESYNFSNVWRRYVNTITSSRESRKLIDDEHLQLARLIFETLTNRYSNQQLVDSFKTFLSTSIDYVYVCEKANWTLYVIIFIFKMNSMILNLCSAKKLETEAQFVHQKIDNNILNALDTVRTSSMIFRILSSSKDNFFTYSNEIFCVTSYFCTKLLKLRTTSVQDKFLKFPSSQHFFKQ